MNRRHGTGPARTALLTRAVLAAGAVLVASGLMLSLEADPEIPTSRAAGSVASVAEPSAPAAPVPDPAAPAEPLRAPAPAPAPVPVVPIDSVAGVPAAEGPSSAAPVRVRYPRLGADLPVLPAGVAADGQMEIPPDAAEAGWYRYGPAPSADAGSTVIAAHAGSEATPEGPLYAIRDARPGDVVTVSDEKGAAHDYEVSTVERRGKDGLDLSPYFTRSGPEQLVLITCGGQWLPERGSYADNIIVVAVPV